MELCAFQRILPDLFQLIKSLPDGSRLPSEPNMACVMKVSRATLREALCILESQGLIRRQRGAGTFVVGRKLTDENREKNLENDPALARYFNTTITIGKYHIEQILADEALSAETGIPRGTKLTRIIRILYSNDIPIAHLIDILLDEKAIHKKEPA